MALINCERDDICAESTATTPRLMVEFYSVTDNDELENVPRLTVYGEGLVTDDDGIPYEPVEESDATLLFDVNASAVELPLEILNDGEHTVTRFILERNTNLRLDDDDTTESNVDIIEIEYSPKFEYVSRACGYKSLFNLFDINLNPNGNDDDTWISNIEIVETIVENEDTVHVRIYH